MTLAEESGTASAESIQDDIGAKLKNSPEGEPGNLNTGTELGIGLGTLQH